MIYFEDTGDHGTLGAETESTARASSFESCRPNQYKKGGICLPFCVLRITNSLMRSQTCILQRISPCVEGSIYGLGSAMKIILILYTLCAICVTILKNRLHKQ